MKKIIQVPFRLLCLSLCLAACNNDENAVVQPPSNPGDQAGTIATPLALGFWGGEQSELQASTQITEFKFACAHGTTNLIRLDPSGSFSQNGTYFVDSGPIIDGDPRHYSAQYSGTVQGGEMNLTVSFSDFLGNSNEYHYRLTQGNRGEISQICPLGR